MLDVGVELELVDRVDEDERIGVLVVELKHGNVVGIPNSARGEPLCLSARCTHDRRDLRGAAHSEL